LLIKERKMRGEQMAKKLLVWLRVLMMKVLLKTIGNHGNMLHLKSKMETPIITTSRPTLEEFKVLKMKLQLMLGEPMVKKVESKPVMLRRKKIKVLVLPKVQMDHQNGNHGNIKT